MFATLKAKLQAKFAKAKLKLNQLLCAMFGHKRPAPSRWDEVPSRTFTCDRCKMPDQNLW